MHIKSVTNLDKYSTIQNCERVEGLSASHCEQGIALKACAPPSPISIISLTPSSSCTVQSSPSLSFSGLAQSRIGGVAHPEIRKPNVHNQRQRTCCIFYHIAYILNISITPLNPTLTHPYNSNSPTPSHSLYRVCNTRMRLHMSLILLPLQSQTLNLSFSSSAVD